MLFRHFKTDATDRNVHFLKNFKISSTMIYKKMRNEINKKYELTQKIKAT